MEVRLNFDYYTEKLYKKTSKELHALSRVSKQMDVNERRVLMKSLVTSQFSYYPLM